MFTSVQLSQNASMFEHIADSTKPLHQCYFIVGERESSREALYDAFLLRDESLMSVGRLHTYEYETISTEIVETLRAETQLRKEETELFCVTASAITHEAQHALLKLLEEPTPNTHFFFLLPSEGGMLDTIRSRAVLIHNEQESLVGKKFLALNQAERLKYVEKMIKNNADTETSGPLREEALELLTSLEVVLSKPKDIQKNASVLTDILDWKKMLVDRQAPVKMILEYIALVV